MSSDLAFHEKQYLGFNRYGIIRRTVVMLFCFIFYFVSNDKENSAVLFFYLGIAVLIISGIAMMISHLETRIEGTNLHLIGPMSSREVHMDLNGIHDVKVKPYSRFVLNRPMFNLHRRGSVRFFTHGKWCVEFINAKDEIVRLGTQRPEQLRAVLESLAKS